MSTNVIYLTKQLLNQLEFNRADVFNLDDISVLNKVFSDDHFLTLLALNANDDNQVLPLPVGIDYLMRIWQKDDIDINDSSTISRLRDLVSINQHINALNSNFIINDSQDISLDIRYDENTILVILDTTYDGSSANTDKPNLASILQPLHLKIARQVVGVLNKLYSYEHVAGSQWFKYYVDQL